MEQCYIGLKRLQKAIAIYQKTVPGGSVDEFHVSWEPYYLDRNPPPQSIPKRARMLQRFGNEEAMEKAIELLKRRGYAEGIDFKFDGKIGSTRASHKIIKLAGLKSGELQNRVVESLFLGHLEENKDIDEFDDLVEMAARGGLEREEVKDLLRRDGDEGVDREASKARESGINGVPRFLINSEAIDGAQDPSDFFDLFLTLKEEKI